MNESPIQAKVINRQMLTENIMEFTIETYQEVNVIPGQRALFLFEDDQGPFERSYVVVDQDTDNERTMLIFAIKLSDQSRGSAMIRKTSIGSEVQIKGIFGDFVLQNTPFPKVFIGTGMGLVSLLNMAKYCLTEKYLFFSVSHKKDLFYEERIKKIHGLWYEIHISQESTEEYASWRIDLIKHHFDSTTEFYLAGKAETVDDILSKLTLLWYKRIYVERR